MLIRIHDTETHVGEIEQWVRDRTGAHRTTVRRWRRRGYPPIVRRLAALELGGHLGLIHAAWKGWRIERSTGELVAPEEYAARPFRPEHVLAAHTILHMITAPTRRHWERAMKTAAALVFVAAIVAAPLTARADDVSQLHVYRTRDGVELQILGRADVGAIRDLITITINGEPVVEKLRLGQMNPKNVGQGTYNGLPVTAECELYRKQGRAMMAHRCEIFVGSERAAILDF